MISVLIVRWGILPTTVNAYYAPTENKIGMFVSFIIIQ